jgi:hypothetical protein
MKKKRLRKGEKILIEPSIWHLPETLSHDFLQRAKG